MDIMSGIVVFFTLWWVVLFMALPFGVHSRGAHSTVTPESGHDHGAPEKSYLKVKLLATTLVTIILWFGIDYLISIKIINFRELAG